MQGITLFFGRICGMKDLIIITITGVFFWLVATWPMPGLTS